MGKSYVVMLDGGFVRKCLQLSSGAGEAEHVSQPTCLDVLEHVRSLEAHARLLALDRHRIYWHDAPPLSGRERNPLSGERFDFTSHAEHSANLQLQAALSTSDDVAVRRGEAVFRGWRLRHRALVELAVAPRPLIGEDLVPNVEQKGVDLRIGLDIALLAVRRIVHVVVLVTGDSDLVPAMKLARREGLRVYLDRMGRPVKRTLLEHADYVFPSAPRR
ncbi:MAG: NYN domain-containing protein [Candidatus Eisenbacteria bacterium]|uniref:NYN domain-containing protein n=1 Tax=Eiseniibacteriota bacterium TaxID=2212470 RepID=A0A933SFT0_UNCEI|nr:NYN domain-containing protein [Candidatus Eisenbacteria bacterium]